ncbi:urease subunit alpha [Kineosporia sp. A_224]|uniref:urease subunit alpha n=1 Tax=Kineosporia sp. A_224 TaxID=1962180 RepID=UPI000B4BEDAB|nr:urease subunit alpha [Kineosporia sp. A_224]
MDRATYASVYGPTTGDRVRLGDTGLVVEVPVDDARRGDELLIGYGKTARDGMHLQAVPPSQSCDLVVTGCLLLDPVLGIRKTSIGIRDGRVAAIGRAGNPDTLDGVDVVVGTGTAIVNGEGLIATPGGIDTHVHMLSPRVMEAELSSGMTTVLGQEYGPLWGVGVNDAHGVRAGIAAFDAWPVNVGWLGRGSSSRPGPLEEALVRAGVCGFKVHEDTGAHHRALDTALRVADEHDVQVALHTDGLNEAMSVADTLAVVAGRAVHAFHVEGCGGGHHDVLSLAGVPNVIGSSTNPTLPFGRDATAEHYAMIVSAHGLRTDLPGEDALARDRVRAATMAAEGVLHDLGVVPITSSDAQGMGRAGETWARTFALAGAMKAQFGPLPPPSPRVTGASDPIDGSYALVTAGMGLADNFRVLRYLAKLTLNPALAHGFAHEVGSLAPGRLADVVLWHPAFFGVKPQVVLKAGVPAWGVTGDPNATIDAAEPLVLGPQFGGHGGAAADLSVLFVSQACADAGEDRLPTRRRRVAVRGCRDVGLADMAHHGRTGTVTVDPRTAQVRLDGDVVTSSAQDRVSLSRLYLI